MDLQVFSHCAPRRAVGLSIVIALCGIPSLAIAQTQSGPFQIVPAGLVSTNLPDVKAYPKPPAGFDPLTAPAALLAQHGFPPMPDAQKVPDAYAAWRKAVTAPQKRLENPRLEKAPIFHSPAKIIYGNISGESGRINMAESGATKITNAISTSSYNWSGYAVYDSTNPFKQSLIYSYWNVPTAQQAFGECSGAWDYSAQWVGIDGLGSNDVLQAGTEADAYCGIYGKVPYYAAWIEWYPDFESIISNFVVKAGDVMFVEVWNTSATQGNAYLVDFSEQEAVALTFSAPAGTGLVGNSVEWVLERPVIGASLATLTNYVACPFDFCYSLGGTSYGSAYYPGYAPSGYIYSLQMLDNSGRVISIPYLPGALALWFDATGSAY